MTIISIFSVYGNYHWDCRGYYEKIVARRWAAAGLQLQREDRLRCETCVEHISTVFMDMLSD
jgi:hypothetical protein